MAISARAAAKPGKGRAPARGQAGGAKAAKKSAVKPGAQAGAAAGGALGPAITLRIAQPGKDPRFKATLDKLNKSAAKARTHAPAGKKAAEAQAAALPPANEKLAAANANKADNMGAAETGKPDNNSFLAMLRAEIQKAMPKKTEDAKDFMQGDDKNRLKNAMTGNVQQQKGEATAGMQGAAAAPPDTSAVEGKEVTPLAGEGAPPAPVAVDAAAGMPAPKPAGEISLEQGKNDTEKLMTDAAVTTPQLEKANDPKFTAVIKTKGEADRFADTGPKQYQDKEQKVLGQAAAQAGGDEKKGLMGFLAQGAKALKAVRGGQLSAKQKDELERKKVTEHIQSIFDRTKASVDKKLASLDDEVSGMFDTGSEAAVTKMKDYVESRFDDRYSGLTGKGRWIKDKLLPLPDSVKAWFDQANAVFLQELDNLVVRVAALVERRLKEAKDEIARGQKEIREYVQGLPANLQSVGKSAEKEMQGRFDELRQGVEDKKNDLAQKLAQRYKDASEKGAKALQEMKDAHKSLYERVRDAIAEVIKVLRDFKNRILAMLKKAKNAVDIIVSDPIGFLKNVLAAIKKGLGQFVDNIWTHLKAGFMAWLFGSIAESGVDVPKDFSLGSILKLVLQILGLTYQRLRAKAVKLLGERAVAVIEQVAKFIWVLVTEGPAKLWEMIKEYLSNLKEMIIDAIQEWVITTVIKAAVTKLVSMFNPVGAIIQAIITIYNVVMFLIERINQILAFVEAVINSVYDIATGAIGTAANWIEKALARTIPIIIAFLARLLGITGIAEKIVGIIKKIQAKVDQALDKVIAKVVAGVGKFVGGVKAGAGKVFEWWKKRIPFRGKDGKKHDIYFSGSGPSAALTVASTPQVLETYLSTIDIKKLDQNQKGSLALITKKKGEIDKIKKDTGGSFGQEAGQKIEGLLTEIAAELPKLGGVRPPPSSIKWTTKNVLGDKVGIGMVANPLSIDPGGHAGSQPFEESALWKAVKHRSGAYVKGHLLNHHVHGPGANYNLVPITGSLNTTMESRVEEKVKHAVLSENRIIKYEVDVKFGQPARRHLPAESELPTKIDFSAIELEEKNGSWVPTSKKLPIPASLPHQLPSDESVGVVHEEVNLSVASKAKLDAIPGIGPVLAARIVQLRSKRGGAFHTYDDLQGVDGIGDEKVAYLREQKWIKLY